MTLRSCGTVVAKENDHVIVRIEQERCANCVGCVRFSYPKKISAIGTQAIGERVAVRSSAMQLALASLLAFGLPISTFSLAVWVSSSIWIVLVMLALSITTVYAVMLFAPLGNFLKVYAETI
ncbi:MAG: SoxR reducing system RseC family protein [Gammaproteobacteria bacterium]|nr:SoxR reducing system RseC family protein [Gammaproteobacteria bacterium]